MPINSELVLFCALLLIGLFVIFMLARLYNKSIKSNTEYATKPFFSYPLNILFVILFASIFLGLVLILAVFKFRIG